MHVLMSANAAWNILHFRRPLVDALQAQGHRITVLAPPDDAAAELQALGCRYVPLDMQAKGLNPLADLVLTQRFRRIFGAEKPDVVLSYTIKNNLFGAYAAKSVGVPFMPNVTGLGTAFLSGSALERVAQVLYRRAFARLPVVFFQNSDDQDFFRDLGVTSEAQSRLLPGSGVDLAHFATAPYPKDDAPVFLMIGRLLRDKGVLEYVHAARSLRQSHPKARFRLLGQAGSENRTAIDQATVDGWVAEGIIDYRGTTDDVRPEIAEAHCVVLPSYREGAPRTLIEAAAMARPLIATDVPGCRAVVAHGATGLLCAARDGEALAQACRDFLALPLDARRSMGQGGRHKMETEFDQRIVVEAYLQAISDVTGQSVATKD